MDHPPLPEIILTDAEMPTGTVGEQSNALVRTDDPLPVVLPAVPVSGLLPFPPVIFPLLVTEDSVSSPVEYAKANGSYLALLPENIPTNSDNVDPHIGVATQVLKDFILPDGERSVLLKVLSRLQYEEIIREKPFHIIKVKYPKDEIENPELVAALHQQLRGYVTQYIEVHPHLPDELKVGLFNVGQPGELCDLIGQHFIQDDARRLSILSAFRIDERLRITLEIVLHELQVLTLGNKITREIHERAEAHQKEFFLREQLKAIRRELGEEKDSRTQQHDELAARLDQVALPDQARTRATDELQRLDTIPIESPEFQLTRTYLEWLASLPWQRVSTDRVTLRHARQTLNDDHYGLDKVKERIIEFLAVRQLRRDPGGTILCLAGPPGVGKTSLGQSIARAMGREFYRFSLGGMRDEAEINGHRRTYIGAMPGKILQGLRAVGVNNPVFMLDEIDKLGHDWRGDPSSALLEVLDPAQNHAFLDHYLDIPYDLSQTLFIATANIKSEIPAPLLDRMEVVDLPGYVHEEKTEIALRHLLPRQRKEHGLKVAQLKFGKRVARELVANYTHEAGVRELQRQIAKLCRRAAIAVVSRRKWKPTITVDRLPRLIGPPRYERDRLASRPHKGVAIGLAWTPVGGEVLLIEAAKTAGKGTLTITGHLGDVMRESVSIAMTCVRACATDFGVPPPLLDQFRTQDLHIHFPAGAVPKDGPSAGITIASALFSLMSGWRLKSRLAMTGELTLRGDVLPVGGVRDKIIAARRAGVTTIILPARNRHDLAELPDYVAQRMKFVLVERLDQVLPAAFPDVARRSR